MRKHLPERRRSLTQKVRMAGQVFYLGCGEYEDGQLGEIFIDSSRLGTFVRGMCGALARMVSIALQNGVSVEEVVACLGTLNFPPQGKVDGSEHVSHAVSVPDWIAQEIAAVYLPREREAAGRLVLMEGPLAGKTVPFPSQTGSGA
jgi:ribonucleoside-diphosphate reductase alpha chain